MRRTYAHVFSILISTLITTIAAADVLSTNSTYQGHIVDGSGPINGTYDFDFGLWNAVSDGWEVAEPLSVREVSVRKGNFTVDLDFGAEASGDGAVFLSVCVKSTANNGPCTELASRQPLTATPQGWRALNANNGDQIAGELALRTSPQLVIDQGKTGVGTATPKSTLDVAGNLTLRTRTVSTGSFGTINVAENDLVLFTSASDDYYVQLPPASADTVGRVYMIYDTSPGSYLQLQADGTDTISGTTYGGGSVFYFMVIGNSPTSWASVVVGL